MLPGHDNGRCLVCGELIEDVLKRSRSARQNVAEHKRSGPGRPVTGPTATMVFEFPVRKATGPIALRQMGLG